MNELLYYLDMFGVISFTISASLLALRKKLDPFGIIVISIITAIGGGTLRDVLLQNHPIFWIKETIYIIIICGTSLLTQLFYRRIIKIENILLIFDAIGIGIFTVIGIKTSLSYSLHPIICIMMGVMTAVFGGLIRDVLCNEIPLILHKEVYATICLMGGILFFILRNFSLPLETVYIISIVSIIVIRIIAIKYNLSLPKIPQI